MTITPKITNDTFAAQEPAAGPSREICPDCGGFMDECDGDYEMSEELLANLQSGMVIGNILENLPDRVTAEDNETMLQLMSRLDDCSDHDTAFTLPHKTAMRVRGAMDHLMEETDDMLSLLTISDEVMLSTLEHLDIMLSGTATKAQKAAAVAWMSQCRPKGNN